jgi:predicted phosphodiesterase
MRVAALYDIHGNLPALEAVLDEVEKLNVDRIVIGGDVVPGPMPRETMARLRAIEVSVEFIRGNGDRVVLAQMHGQEPTEVPPQFRDATRWNAEQLGSTEEEWLGQWPATLRLTIDGAGEVFFCHATPGSDTDIFTKETPEERLRTSFAEAGDAALVVCGHTHMQFDCAIGRNRVVNAGSVGMPFGLPGAYWLLIDQGVALRRTEYDFLEAAQRIRATAYPEAEQFASNNVLRPPSEKEMLELFNRVAL